MENPFHTRMMHLKHERLVNTGAFLLAVLGTQAAAPTLNYET
jgi:hypothetical protein